MRVSASLGFWYFLIFIVVWRQLLKNNTVQKAVHDMCGGYVAALVQWYTLYGLGVVFYMGYSIHELMTAYDSLDQHQITANLERTYNLSMNEALRNHTTFDQFKESLLLRPWLRYLNLASQFAGIPVCLLTLFHVLKFMVLKSKRLADQNPHWKYISWKPPTRMNWLLLVITMPSMFSVMSMRATCRILALMTGTAYGHDTQCWTEVKSLEFAMYTSDLELAALFQFSTTYAFARICGSILSDADFFRCVYGEETNKLATEYTRTIKAAGFIGVWAFVVVGGVRSLLSFIIAEAEQFDGVESFAETLQRVAHAKISIVFTALTILCVINMVIICKMSIITLKLGNANMKFMGTRILLLCGEVQSSIVAAFTVGSSLYQLVDKYGKEFNLSVVHKWHFFEAQGDLFHLSLLNFECLVVVIFNLIAWSGLELEDAGIITFKPLKDLTKDLDSKEDGNEDEEELLEDTDF